MASTRQNAFGIHLRTLRKAARLTQEELAERAGVSLHTITNLERGVAHTPRRDTIMLVAEALQLTGEQRSAFEEAAFALWHETPTSVPAPAPTSVLAPRLPIPATSLLGRETDLRTASDLLDRSPGHLLTVCGPPGVGKTRLALELARRKAGEFPDGVVFVSLAPLTDPALVEVAIAHSLGVTEQGGVGSLRGNLMAALAGKHVLLLLDNFEHVLSAAPVVSGLLSAPGSGVRVLVTSRAPLRLQGEQEYPVAPLAVPAVPDASDPTTTHLAPDALEALPAVALFIERARSVRPSWAPSAADIGCIAAICRQLDGLPLAIELAAAHIRLFSPQALLIHLNHHQPLLDTATHDAPPRQRTLQDAIAWSYRLLRPEVQLLFRRLAVFAGSFSMEAATTLDEQVPDKQASPGEDWETDGNRGQAGIRARRRSERKEEALSSLLASLATLVEQHLLRMVDGPENTVRFGMLATIRAFAGEELTACGEAEMAYARYTEYYTALAEAAQQHLTAADQREWLARLDAERDNLRGALQWALDTGQLALGGRLAAALWRYWQMRGLLVEGSYWLERLLAAQRAVAPRADNAGDAARVVPMSPSDEGNVYNAAGVLAMFRGNLTQAEEYLETGLALRRAHGDLPLVAGSLNNLALVATERGAYQRAATLYEECLDIRRTLDPPVAGAITSTLSNLGMVARHLGEYERARSVYEEVIALQQTAGNQYGVALALGNLALVETECGHYDHAKALLEESLGIQRALGHPLHIAISLNNLAEVLTYLGDHEPAHAHCTEALALVDDLGNPRARAAVLVQLANVTRGQGGQGDLDRARTLYAEALALYRGLHHRLGTAETLLELGHLACLEERWDDAGAYYQESIERTGEDEGAAPRHAAICLTGLACVLSHRVDISSGDGSMAVRLFATAEHLREEWGFALPPLQRMLVEAAIMRLRAQLGSERYAEAWAQGHADGAAATREEALRATLAAIMSNTAALIAAMSIQPSAHPHR